MNSPKQYKNSPHINTIDPLSSIGELLLAAVAIRVELPPSLHQRAIDRKAAIEKHLCREGSFLRDLIRLFYPQGSMSIGATIKDKFQDCGYDIDIIVETLLNDSVTPRQALDFLFEAMRGEPGSKYYNCTERQSRCVTVHYADGMHLDLTPSILLDDGDPRLSYIFHSKPGLSEASDQRILTNSHAFTEEYNHRCPPDLDFAKAYGKRARMADSGLMELKSEAESEPVPLHSSITGAKSAHTVALLLWKRNRNIKYYNRTGRMPPSVALTCLSLDVARPGRTIGANLYAMASHCLNELRRASKAGHTISVTNPRCGGDCFTDRWPENITAQNLYADDLEVFLLELEVVMDDQRSLRDRSDQLKKMFGESPAREALDEIGFEIANAAKSGIHGVSKTGAVLLAPSSVYAARPKAPSNTFFGTKWPED